MSAKNWADDEASSDEGERDGPESHRKKAAPEGAAGPGSAPPAAADGGALPPPPSDGHHHASERTNSGSSKGPGPGPGDRRPPPRDDDQRPPRRPTASAADVPSHPPFVAYVGNLPFSATMNDVGDFFYHGGCNVKDVDVKMGDDGRPRGYATVEFADRDSLVKALTATGANFGGRQLRVDVDTKKPPQGGGGSRREGGGFRDRDRDRDGGGASAQDGGDEVWSRAPKREPAKVPPPSRAPKPTPKKGEDGADGPGAAAAAAATPPTPPASRPVIKLQPRTLPVDAVGQLPGVPNQSIFGGGKPHDEKTYEVRNAASFLLGW